MEPTDDLRKFTSEAPIPVTDIDIRSLAEIYDERDVYLSVYLPTENEHANRSFVAHRLRAIRKALDHDMLHNFDDTVAMLQDTLFSNHVHGERGRIVFASAPHSFLHVYRIALVPDPRLVLDTSPFLLPLAKLRDDYQDYWLLLIDSEEARLFLVRSDIMEERDHISVDLMNKHKKGGWSQMRYNRLRKGAIKTFFAEVLEDLEKMEDLPHMRGLVIAGPGEAKHQFMEMLPQHLKNAAFGTMDVSMNASKSDLMSKGDEILLQDENSRSRADAEELKAAILKGGAAVYGAEAVRDALIEGKVRLLLLLEDTTIPGWICERCQNLQVRVKPPETCPRCGGPASIVDVIEELYEMAERTDAEVEFVDEDEYLASKEGVGALLRY
jgi:peptide chain release factor subunit 1